jgi:thiamine biosynthesis lipoprotein
MQLHSVSFDVMGGPASIHLFARDGAVAGRAVAAAIAETRRLQARYSRYDPDSLLSCLNARAAAGGEVLLDPETCALVDFAFTCHAQSEGLFDITSGILRQAWNFESGEVPRRGDIEALLPNIGMDKLDWDPPRLRFTQPGMELDLGGLVKEYAADRAAHACAAASAPNALVELAGDISAAGPQADGSPWIVGVRHPRAPEQAVAVLELARGGLASSGDYERWFEADGIRYCHILNPRTGWPAQGLAAVSVVAASCQLAGALATTAMLKALDAGAWLAAAGVPHLWIDTAGRHGGDIPLTDALAWPG